MWTVYCRTNVQNGMRYVGITAQSLGERWAISTKNAADISRKVSDLQRKLTNPKLDRVSLEKRLKKAVAPGLDYDLAVMGEEVFEHRVLETHACMVCGLLAEQRLIVELDTLRPRGYNKSPGGEIGRWVRIDQLIAALEQHKACPPARRDIVQLSLGRAR